MRGVRLTVAYDGKEFCGWQRQPGRRTVQGVLEHALSEWHGTDVEVRGASRTDSGVHAWGQVASFNTPFDYPVDAWVYGLNRRMQRDVSVREASFCDVDYRPRFDARYKHYRYLVYDALMDHPCWINQSWCLGPRMHAGRFSMESAQASLPILIGRKSFHAFCAADDAHVSTVVEVLDLKIRPYGDLPNLWAFDVIGTAFLKNMVRIMVGTIVEVAVGMRDAASVGALFLPEASRIESGVTAPPHGLTLMHIELGRETRA